MGVLYNLSMPCRCHTNHAGFSPIDDRQLLFSSRHRSPSYSETASSPYHTCLLNICRVGHVRDAISKQSLPGTGDHNKSNQGIVKAKDTKNDLLALSGTTIIRARSVSYDDIFWDSDMVLKGSVRQSRRDAIKSRLNAVEDAATVGSRPRLRSKSLGDNPTAAQKKPLSDIVKGRPAANPPQEQQIISSIIKRNEYAADAPLPSSRFSKRLVDRSKSRKHGTTAIAGGSEKREREDSDDDITRIPILRKKAKRRTLKVTVSVKAHEAKVKFSASPAKLGDQPSLFDVARWLDVDWQSVHVDPPKVIKTCQPSVQSSQADANPTEARSASLSITFSINPRSNKPNVDAEGFVSAIQKFNEVVGSCDASARFAQNQGRCLANNQRGTRCRSWHGIPVDDRPIVGTLLAELKGLNYESRPSFCVNKLLTFTNLAVCPYQRVEIRKRVAGLPQRRSEIPDEKGLVKYLPQIVPYRPPGSAQLTVSEFVMQQAMEPFDVIGVPEKELGEGYLYVYWNEATFGVRKIGFTTHDVDDRLKDWETNCRRTAKEEYRSPFKVRHAAKVEQLVHADLLEHRVREPACRTCLKSHIEWFRGVSLTFIIGRIEAWSQWISDRPYEQVGGQWCLTDSGRDSMPLLM